MKTYKFSNNKEAKDFLERHNFLRAIDKLEYKGEPCQVVGFNYKKTPKGSINNEYSNLIIKVLEPTHRQFNINIEYFRSMNY